MDTITPTDETLVRCVAAGDERALALLYDRHGATAYRLAVRVVRDPTLAEDVVQEAFLAVWHAARSFDPARGRPSTWINVLVHRRAVDAVRREERARRDVAAADLPGLDPGFEAGVLAEASAERVRAAVARLTPAQREVIVLAFYGGLTQSEIACRLGVPLGTVKSRTFLALSRLRDALEHEQVESAEPLPATEPATVLSLSS